MIIDKTPKERAVLMARLSNLSYNNNYNFTPEFKFDSIFIDRHDSELYVLYDATDIIVVCRGTQFDQLADLLTVLDTNLVHSKYSTGRIHEGFKNSVDDVWVDLADILSRLNNRQVWLTGHSLGAAMATEIANRCSKLVGVSLPILYTFGSPRVGDYAYINDLSSHNIEHHRWVNNADIITRNPIFPYHHHGILHYFDHHGKVAALTFLQIGKDRVKGIMCGLTKGKVSFIIDHGIDQYIKNLEKM